MARILPKPHVLQSIVNQNLTWPKAIAEFVDNSFDAGAQRVVVTYRDHCLKIEDDGSGVRDLLSMVTLGMHDRQATTKLGRYGIGAKEAWLWCGPAIDIESVHSKKRGTLRVDYREIAATDWECADPVFEDTTEPSGTKIKIRLSAERKHGPTVDAMSRLSWVFSPALERGRQIVFASGKTRTAIEPMRMPVLENSIRSQFDIDGRSVEIDIGTLPDGERLKYGPFWLRYGHRVICECSLGAGQYSTLKMGGIITLGDGWKLTKHKDDLSENEDRLAEAIFARIEPALKAGERLAESVETSALRAELEAALNSTLQANSKRPRTGKGARPGFAGKSGSIASVSSGRSHKTATIVNETPDGVVVERCTGGDQSVNRRSGFNFDWCEMDSAAIGKYERLGNRVSLNILHPWIADAKQSGNRASLCAAMCVLIAEYDSTHKDKHKLLAFDYGSVSEAFGRLISTLPAEASNAKRQAS